MKSDKKEIQMYFSSLSPWNDSHVWDEYFREVEALLNDRLIKLDENDPVRRKADTKADQEGEYVTKFGALEGCRTVFGEFAKSKIHFSINCNNEKIDPSKRPIINRINYSVPVSGQSMNEDQADVLAKLFAVTIERFGVFLAESDLTEFVVAKKTHDGYSLDIESELLGVLWLTYFSPKYVSFFTKERLLTIPGAKEGPADGVIIRLATSPQEIPSGARRNAEKTLGERFFAGYERITDFNKRKLPGQLPSIGQLGK